jgi:hypothetical protein
MASILRWFDVDGQRHRAWYRGLDTGSRHMVIAGPDWRGTVESPDGPLDDLTDKELAALTSRIHPASMEDPGR